MMMTGFDLFFRLGQMLLSHLQNKKKLGLIKLVLEVGLGFRGEYFPLGCDNHHGIVSKFDQISEKFLFQKSKKSVTFEKTVKKNPDFHILFGLIVHSND